MLKHILFCDDCFWVVFNCPQNLFLKKAFKKKKQRKRNCGCLVGLCALKSKIQYLIVLKIGYYSILNLKYRDDNRNFFQELWLLGWLMRSFYSYLYFLHPVHQLGLCSYHHFFLKIRKYYLSLY